MDCRHDLIGLFLKHGLIKRKGAEYPDGFLLKSGVISDIYINIRELINYPTVFNLTVHCLWEILPYAPAPLLGIPTMGAVLAPILAYKKCRPLLVIRQHTKNHGLGKNLEGQLVGSVTIVDDVITSGSSIQEVKDAYITPQLGNDYESEIVVILDRQEHQLENVKSVMTLEDIRSWKPRKPATTRGWRLRGL